MSQPFLGEIRMVGFNFPPRGWALCNGQLMAISQNSALFGLLGTTYGGDGQTTFALPNLQGRVPIHAGTGPGLSPYVQGQVGGNEAVTLLTTQIPAHNHGVNANAAGGTQASPVGGYPAIESTGTSMDYSASAPNQGPMNAGMIAPAGGNQAHENRQPYLCVNFIIAMQGIFPSRN
jgi:microcystin-dependent protein